MPPLPRRAFLALVPAAAAFPMLGRAAAPAASSAPSPTAPPAARAVPDLFPTQPPELVREMVGVSHANLARVTELLASWPSLARAAWDWGFGDWETALGAASHTGRRDIAELLLAHGARPDIFAAAMLGQLDVVRAFVSASPGVQRTHGPHGITLLAHARAGGPEAGEVVKYLESLGDADVPTPSEPLDEAGMTALTGTYAFGESPQERIVVAIDRGILAFERAGTSKRMLVHRGERAFSPVGVENVRIRFELRDGAAASLAVHDPGPVLVARRLA